MTLTRNRLSYGLFGITLMLLSGCGGGLSEYKATCGKISGVVSRLRAADSRLQNTVKTLLESCGGDGTCTKAIKGGFLPIAVAIGDTYSFAEALQRGGVCSPESVAYLSKAVDQIEGVERALRF